MNRYLVDEATLRALLDAALFLRSLHKDTEERTARSEAAIITAQTILAAPPTSVEIDPTKLPPLPFGSYWGRLSADHVPNRPGVATLGTMGHIAPIKPHKADE